MKSLRTVLPAAVALCVLAADQLIKRAVDAQSASLDQIKKLL